MKYSNFKELPVWQDAIDLAVRVFDLTDRRAFAGRGDLANQAQRAALSVSNNVAEGFERQTVNELLQFLYYAKGSAGEVVSMCCVMRRLTLSGVPAAEIDAVEELAESVSRQLGAWAASQRDGGIDGKRYMGSREKHRREEIERGEAFRERLRKEHEALLERLRQERTPPSEGGSNG